MTARKKGSRTISTGITQQGKLLVFLCWSGDRSRKCAEVFNTFLRQYVQAAQPWMSPDIEKGARWRDEIGDALARTSIGIVCLTPENLTKPYVLFEAGALSKLRQDRACTFLLDISPGSVEPPLGDFQATPFEKGQVKRLLDTVRDAAAERNLPTLDATASDALFAQLWPQMEAAFEHARKTPTAAAKQPQRRVEDMVEEVLTIVRTLKREESRLGGLTLQATGSVSPQGSPRPSSVRFSDAIGFVDATGRLTNVLDATGQPIVQYFDYISPRGDSSAPEDDSPLEDASSPPRRRGRGRRRPPEASR